MIANINNSYGDQEDQTEFTTDGCGCCSATYYLPQDREEILKELQRNIIVAKDACKALGIDFQEFVNTLN